MRTRNKITSEQVTVIDAARERCNRKLPFDSGIAEAPIGILRHAERSKPHVSLFLRTIRKGNGVRRFYVFFK